MQVLEKRIIQLLWFLLPVQLAYHFWPDFSLIFGVRVDYLSPTIYLTDLLIATIGVLHVVNRWSQRFFPQVLSVLVFLFVIVNIFYSFIEPLAVMRWGRVVEYLLFGWVLLDQKNTILYVKPLAGAAVYTFFIAALQFLMQKNIGGVMRILGERPLSVEASGMATINLFGRELLRPYATFPHPNVLGAFGLVVLLVLLSAKVKSRLVTMGRIACLGIIVISFSQAIWVATLVMLFTRTFSRSMLQKFLYVFVIALTVISVGMMFIKPQFHNYALDSRIALAQTAGYLFNESPVIGHGLGNFIPVNQINILNLLVARDARLRFQPVHNIELLLLTEVGIIGLAIVITWLLRFIKMSSKIGLVGLLIILVTGLVDHYWLTLHQASLLVVLIIVLGLGRKLATMSEE